MTNVLYSSLINSQPKEGKLLNDAGKKRHLGAKAWLCAFLLSLLTSAILALALIWISIDSTDIAYSIDTKQRSLDEKLVHLEKLEVERERLLSPYLLDKQASALGMQLAEPGQIRRIEENTSPLK